MTIIHRSTFVVCLLLPVLALATPESDLPPQSSVPAAETQTLVYLEKTGERTGKCVVTTQAIGRKSRMEIHYEDDDSYGVFRNEEGAVTRIDMSRKDGTRRRFERQGKSLLVHTGSQTRKIDIDEAPLIQTAFMLASFARSPETKLEFWTVTSSDAAGKDDAEIGEVIKLVAKKKGLERIRWGATEMDALKVVLTLPDLRSLFWESRYWLRPNDGVVLRYAEDRGGPGNNKTIGELAER